MTKVYAICNQKGGVAKTTSTLNLGAALAILGKKVLLIDLDPQGSLTKSAGFRDVSKCFTTYEVIKGDTIATAPIKTVEDAVAEYNIMPSDIRLSSAEVELLSEPGRDTLLKAAISDLDDDYDYILIDCSPSLNILTLMALTAANGVIIPVAAQYMPLDGMAQLLKTIDLVKKRLNKSLYIAGVIITMYDKRRSLDKEIVKAIRAKFPTETFNTMVKNSSKIAEAPTYGKDIFRYAPKSAGADAYKVIAYELIERG